MAYPYGEPLSSTSKLAGRDSVDLLARMIYSEARGESWAGKQGVAHVAENRKAKNTTEFGGNTFEGVILKKNQFVGMTTSSALAPDLTSSSWSDSLYIAKNMATQDNTIGSCLWFVTNDYYADHSRVVGGKDEYTFGSGYNQVVEKTVIDNHTFFRVSGY